MDAAHTQLTQALSLSLLYLATAASYGSARVRGRTRLAWLDAPSRSIAARVCALAAVGVAYSLWRNIESGPAAGFVVIVGIMVAGTLFSVLSPLAPRSVWASALLSLVLIPVLAVTRVVLS